MRDYEKLIKNLRIHATGECEDCSCYDPDPFLPCSEQLANDAADAIEELLAERDRYKSFFDRITDLPDCNICLKKNRCEFEPRPGEYTRINCAFCLTEPPKGVE